MNQRFATEAQCARAPGVLAQAIGVFESNPDCVDGGSANRHGGEHDARARVEEFLVVERPRNSQLGRQILGAAARKTYAQLRLPVVTIAFILSIATVMNYSGMTSSMALALAATGWLFPFFSAWLGMLGVFLTGSDTSSNTLFGPLQATTARVSGLDPVLMGATNSSAGVMGKMISPQNLSVGAAGVGAVGREGEIFSRVIMHSLILTALMGILAMLQQYVVPWMIPTL